MLVGVYLHFLMLLYIMYREYKLIEMLKVTGGFVATKRSILDHA